MNLDLKTNEMEINVLKVAQLGTFMNNEKLKDITDDNKLFFQNKNFSLSMKERQIYLSKDSHLSHREDSEEVKNNAEDNSKPEAYASFLSYSLNSFENNDIKRTNSFMTHKTNFARSKRNLSNEFLEDLEGLERKPLSDKIIEPNTKEKLDNLIFTAPINLGKNELNKDEDVKNDEEYKNQLLIVKNSFLLIFDKNCDPSLINEYNQNLLSFGTTAIKVGLILYSLISFVMFFSVFFIQDNKKNGIYAYILTNRILLLIFPLVLLKFSKELTNKYKKIILFLIFTLSYYFIFKYCFNNEEISSIFELILFLNVTLSLNIFYYYEIFMFVSLICLIFLANVGLFQSKAIRYWLEMVFLICNCVFMLHKQRKKHARCIDQYNAVKLNIYHKNQQESLITYLLPPHIFSALTQNNSNNSGGSNQIVDIIDNVTILFADIAGFTKYSSSVSALEVLSMLRELFTEFDKLCLNYKVYKLYTIGDCYVVLGFLDIKNRDPSMELLKVLMVAFNMIEIITNVKRRINFNDLNMRIGIHTVYCFMIISVNQ